MTSAAAAAAVAAQAFLTRRGTGIDTQSRHTTFMREDKQGGGSCLTLCTDMYGRGWSESSSVPEFMWRWPADI